MRREPTAQRVASMLPDNGVELASLFSALANATRLELLQVMVASESEGSFGDGGHSIERLARRAEVSRFSASRHLAIMRDVGLVDADRIGHATFHRLKAERLETLEDWLYPLLDAVDGRP